MTRSAAVRRRRTPGGRATLGALVALALVTTAGAPSLITVRPGDTLQSAAQLMDELNVGVLPVVDGGELIGILTDRDIVIRSTSAGQDPNTAKVSDAMTTDAQTLQEDASVEEAVEIMEERQLRRVPVVNGAGRLVGIVSLGDLAASGTPEAADALEAISTPAEPDR